MTVIQKYMYDTMKQNTASLNNVIHLHFNKYTELSIKAQGQ